ncbi:hypothetical protein E2C01_060684 [Portunus trituberculatus]|uniref:Uncharacterized protein n=1 Tax=Portunus trituberculatus TaxID=210409 RepID=A0A5B7HA47_PORTR|nr:hypothetical protein [Portunus trituberculatus]
MSCTTPLLGHHSLPPCRPATLPLPARCSLSGFGMKGTSVQLEGCHCDSRTGVGGAQHFHTCIGEAQCVEVEVKKQRKEWRVCITKRYSFCSAPQPVKPRSEGSKR